MGLHEVCRNPYHHFDIRKDLRAQRIEINGERDVLYQGYCKDCGHFRVVYGNELKNRKVIEAKMKGKRY